MYVWYTFPSSTIFASMTILSVLYSHVILQKSDSVFGFGPKIKN